MTVTQVLAYLENKGYKIDLEEAKAYKGSYGDGFTINLWVYSPWVYSSAETSSEYASYTKISWDEELILCMNGESEIINSTDDIDILLRDMEYAIEGKLTDLILEMIPNSKLAKVTKSCYLPSDENKSIIVEICDGAVQNIYTEEPTNCYIIDYDLDPINEDLFPKFFDMDKWRELSGESAESLKSFTANAISWPPAIDPEWVKFVKNIIIEGEK